MARIHVIHENPAWLPPLAAALDQRGLPWTDWFLHEGAWDLSAPPPEGVPPLDQIKLAPLPDDFDVQAAGRAKDLRARIEALQR